jgi:cyclic pyranopterin phosphate synthase
MFDSFNREITYLRISVTDLCNLRCTYCMPAEGVKLRPRSEFLSYEEIAAVAREAAGLGITKIRLTGGEPLVKKDIADLVRMLKSIPGVREVGLTTNGTLLAPLAAKLKDAGLDRINVSLDTLEPDKYREITRGGDIAAVLRGIEAVRAAGFLNTKINMVLIPGVNESDAEAMAAFCRAKGFALQRIHHYSLRERGDDGDPLEAERPHPSDRGRTTEALPLFRRRDRGRSGRHRREPAESDPREAGARRELHGPGQLADRRMTWPSLTSDRPGRRRWSTSAPSRSAAGRRAPRAASGSGRRPWP